MNEELQNTLNITLQGLIENTVQLKEFMVAEIPDVLQQLIVWKTASYGVLSIFFLIASVLCVWGSIKKENCDPFWLVLIAVGCTLVFLVNFLRLLQITLAPKVWLLGYGANLVNGVGG